MLTILRIRDLAIVEDLVVEFGAGFNVLTGETGAGKSILVDALGLAAGDRADATLVRTGSERAVVEAAFDLTPGGAVDALLRSRGVDLGRDANVVVRREVASSGGGRVFLNGSPATVAVLREAGDLLVELHGQHEHQSLLLPERHQEILDAVGGCRDTLERVAAAHGSVVSARERLRELARRVAQRRDRTQELQRIVGEIDAANPRPGESDDLDRRRRVLQNAGRVAALLEEAVGLLHDGEPSAAGLAAGAARRVSELAALDPTLADVAGRIDAARVDLDDAGATLRDYRDRRDFDPERLEAIEARRALLERLRLRYGTDEAAILRARDEAAHELDSLRDLDEEVRFVEREGALAESGYAEATAELTLARQAAARTLGSAVEGQLRALALEKARLDVAFAPARGPVVERETGEPIPLHPRGAERVEFLLAANPGEAPRPLARVASGGELSRLMLALHGVQGDGVGGRVLVFDEVDAGVGGAVADALGSRLARLGRRHQVLCVTHLPQVAAHADRHYHVRKRVVRGRTRAEVVALSEEERVDELARMLGGREVTPASRRNAAELLAAAAEDGRARSRRGP